MQEITSKRCTKCGEAKPITDFRPRQYAHRVGWTSWCNPCHAAYGRKRYASDEAYRNESLARSEERRGTQDYKDRKNAARRNKYRQDPEYRAKAIARVNEWSANNPGKALERRRIWGEKNKDKIAARTIKNISSRLYQSVNSRAKKEGVPCDITPEWIEEKLHQGVCEISGIEFELAKPPGTNVRVPNSPSIDRIVAGGSYTQDNCRLVLLCLNIAINDWGLGHIRKVFRAVEFKAAVDAKADLDEPLYLPDDLPEEFWEEDEHPKEYIPSIPVEFPLAATST